ncbi:hypothetical protein ACFQ4L_08570 [Lapidilactobacillus mulanensis]|uniref:Uncharacterized protein n=2 Tax=Lapidilactobacillus mulanensis TaxID=2485999 RepID=A0ABW4DN63_9LACO
MDFDNENRKSHFSDDVNVQELFDKCAGTGKVGKDRYGVEEILKLSI